ncbi:hypothetical protein EIP91_011523, partial [Steccherinum ochraceum]
MPTDPPTKTCNKCKKEKTLDQFAQRARTTTHGAKGTLTANCNDCVGKQRSNRAAKRPLPPDEEDDGSTTPVKSVSVEELWAELNDIVEDEEFARAYRVDFSAVDWELVDEDSDVRARKVAGVISDRTSLHWTFEKKYMLKRSEGQSRVFVFSCAQSNTREHKAKTPRGDKPRDARRMPRFDCGGWLYVTVTEGSSVLGIRIKHLEPHTAYVAIDLPDRWKEYIRTHAKDQLPGAIWKHILATEGEGKEVSEIHIPFRSGAVYYYWNHVCAQEWKCAEDPLDSAKEWLQKNGAACNVATLDVTEEPGTRVLAFQVTDFMKEWARNTQELAMDSTWNTNSGNFEMFSAVAAADGSGVPLAFLMIQTSKDAAQYAKQRVLTSFLGQLKKLGVDPEFTLTDKDWSEINAMRHTWPHAKHQLCFWHALRALKQRLAKNRDAPAHYNVDEAHREFPFIKKEFLPVGQRLDENPPQPKPPDKPIPRVRLLVGGRPPVFTPALPPIRIRLPAAINPDDEQSAGASPPSENFDLEADQPVEDDPATTDEVPDDRSDSGTHWGDREHEIDDEDDPVDEWGDPEAILTDDFRRQVDSFAQSADNFDEDAPTDQAEKGPRTARHKGDYQFCPAAHRLPIMRLFSKHASLHPLLPERHGVARSSAEIRRDAVYEMYQHCSTNHLSEVWAYLWTSWYSAKRWPLWARSAYAESIPTKRTTMMVEALWRNLKRLVLHQYNRPRVDLAVYAVVTKALPPYRLTLSQILRPIAGRSKALSHTQEAMKKAWKRLLAVPIKGTYTLDVSRWTCDCGSQKYHAYLLCKHLVQEVGPMDADWWAAVVRYRIPPYYRVSTNGLVPPAPESSRNHAWLSRTTKGLRVLDPDDDESEQNAPPFTPPSSPPPIESSPDKAPATGADGLMRTRAGGGAGFELDDAESFDTAEIIDLLEFGVRTLRVQSQARDPRFTNNAVRSARGFIGWAQDVR